MSNATSLFEAPKEFALLVVGMGGSGKTTMACQLPRPYIISLDHNLLGPAEYLKKAKFTGHVKVAYADRDKDNNVVEAKKVWDRFQDLVNEAMNDPEVDTVVIDNSTVLNGVMIDFILGKANKDEMTIQLWGKLFEFWKLFVTKMRRGKKMFVLIGHDRVEKDDLTQALEYYLALPGQSADVLPTFFTDVFRCEVEVTETSNGPVHKYIVRPKQTPRSKWLKTSNADLPAKIEVTPENLKKILSVIRP